MTSAVMSPCGKYRYWLERGEPNAPYVAWVLANPSTADAETDDPTVRKARGFTSRWGFKRFVFVNVMAGRSTKPKGLLAMDDPVGPENWAHLTKAVQAAVLVVPAWGNAVTHRLRKHIAPVKGLLCSGLPRVECLGFTDENMPRHPLMMSYSVPLEPYLP